MKNIYFIILAVSSAIISIIGILLFQPKNFNYIKEKFKTKDIILNSDIDSWIRFIRIRLVLFIFPALILVSVLINH